MSLRHVPLVLYTVVIVVAAASARAETTAGASTKIALLPLVGEGLGADEIARVERTLQEQVDARFGSASVPGVDVRARLDAGSAKGLRCDRNQPPCVAQLGIVCRADRVIVATLAPQGAQSTLLVRLVDVGAAEQVAAASARVSAEPTGKEVRALLHALETPGARVTRVLVRGPQGADVLVDDKPAGKLPLDPIEDLPPGRHRISVLGLQRHDEEIDVRRGELAHVDVPAAALVSPAVVPWAGVAGGGVLAVAGTVGLVFGLYPRFAYDDAASRLHTIEGEVGTDRAALAARKAEVEAARADLDHSAEAWTTWGAPLSIGAGVVVTAGIAAASAGVLGLIE